MRKILCFFLFLLLAACQKKPSADTLQVGTIAGPETALMQVAASVAQERYGLHVNIIEFSDYAIPNAALSEGSLDANMFQHAPYLQNAISHRHYPLVAVAKTFIYPMGIYSKKIKTLSALPNKALVVIPNDPTNEARALFLLQKAGLITLKKGSDDTATVLSIESNPKKLTIKEMDAAELPRVLEDVSLAVINTNYAVPAGLVPNQDALFLEDKSAPYANLLVVKKSDATNPKVQQLIEALHSDEVKAKAKSLFNGQAIPAW